MKEEAKHKEIEELWDKTILPMIVKIVEESLDGTVGDRIIRMLQEDLAKQVAIAIENKYDREVDLRWYVY